MKISNYRVGPIMTNCYLAVNEKTKEGFFVDPGAEPGRLIREIKDNDIILTGILLTHGHFDHIMAVNELRDEFQVKVYANELEKEVLQDVRSNMSSGYTTKADVYLTDGEEFSLAGVPIKMLSTPGHTVGGGCYYLAAEGILFSGDTLFHGSVGRTDFPGGSDSTLVRSIQEKLLVLPEETKVYPGHDSQTTIQFEKRYNPFVS